MSSAPAAKRVPPPEVPPVMVGTTRIDAVHRSRDDGFGQNGGVLRATDTKTGAELWTLKVYQIDYDPRLESDVQDVYIKAMRKAMFGNKLLVTDENDRRWRVDLTTRAVSQD